MNIALSRTSISQARNSSCTCHAASVMMGLLVVIEGRIARWTLLVTTGGMIGGSLWGSEQRSRGS